MRRGNLAALAATFALITGGLAACGGDGEVSGKDGNVITLASPIDLTGAGAAYGPALNAGIELAVNTINAEGGIDVDGTKYTLEIDQKDTQSDANVGLAYARGAIADGLKFFIPATGSAVAAGMSEFVSSDTNKAILMSPSVVLGARMTEDFVRSAPGRYTFVTNAGTRAFAATGVSAVKEQFGSGIKVGVLMQNDPQGQAYVKNLVEGLTSDGQTVLDPVYFETGSTDFGPKLARLKSQKPDVIISWYEPVQNLNALKQAIKLGAASKGYLITAGVKAVREAVPGIPDGVTIVTMPSGGIPTDVEGLPESLTAFMADIGKIEPKLAGTAGVSAAIAPYVGVLTLAQAISDAGTVEDTDAIVEALAKVKIDSQVGTLSYTNAHISTLQPYVCVITAAPATCARDE